MWMVYDNEEGLVCVIDNYAEALKKYERCKRVQEDYVRRENEFSCNERVILAKIEKDFYSYDTKKPVIVENEEGNKYPTKDTYWDFKEENYTDYKQMVKLFVGETIKDSFCNGFFGGSNYDLNGAEITKINQYNNGIVIEVIKSNGKYDYGYFDDNWNDWECVYKHLSKWVDGKTVELDYT